MTNELTTIATNSIQIMSTDRRAANLEALLSSLSANTQAQIKSTWDKYQLWCKKAAVHIWQLDAVQVSQFLLAFPARPSTQRARLSHLRTILGLYATTSGDANLQFNAALLQLFRLPSDAENAMYAAPANRRKQQEGLTAEEKHDLLCEPRYRRQKQALQPDEIHAELHRDWATPELTSRNRAIMGLLFYAGLRRSEVCKLKWSDIDFTENIIAIRGAKKRAADHVDNVPLMPSARRLLLDWRQRCSSSREFVFCAVSKSGKLLADKPLSGEKIRLICGDDFTPHDARRTLATRSIENGTPTNYTQKMMGHSSGAMTLKYAEYVEAKELGDKMKLGY